MGDVDPRIQFALMLVGLGLRTAAEIVSFFRSEGTDDETLAHIQAECDKRINQWATINLPIPPNP